MLSIVHSLGYRLWRGVGGSPRWQLPGKRLAVLFLVAGVACSVGLRALLSPAGQLVLWAFLLLDTAWLLRHYRRPIFGPVFFYDLVRSSRRGEQVGHRCIYAILLICVLAAVYWSWFPGHGIADLLRSRSMSIAERARFAGSFFSSFVTAQFVVVYFITPLYTASAIAEQKERRTLDFLLITDLSNREIVVGMLGARLAKLLLLLLTGLPILSLLEFLGGVDPGLVLVSFVATCMLLVSVGSASILVSVYARTALSAVIVAYLATLPMFAMTASPWSKAVAVASALASLRPGSITAVYPINLVGPLVAGSFIEGVVAITCCRIAVAQMRRVAMAQASGTPGGRKIPTTRVDPIRRVPYRVEPAVMHGGWGPAPAPVNLDRGPRAESVPRQTGPRPDSDALLWKELHAEGAFGFTALRQLRPRATLAILALLILLIACLNEPQARHGVDAEYIQGWVLRMEIVLIFVLLLIVALSASRRVSRERERRTLDNLLMVPVTVDSILFAKWLGSILSVRRLWWLLGPIWGIAVVADGMHIFALPLLAAATVVYAGFVASVGLWFSTVSGSTMRAGLFTLLVALVFLAVPGALATAGSFSANLTSKHPFWMWQALLMEYGLSPPATFWVLTFRSTDLLKGGDHLVALARILAAVAGLHFYMAVTAILWLLTRKRLRNA